MSFVAGRGRTISTAACLFFGVGTAAGQATIAPQPSQEGPAWQGWGTSIAWWGEIVGGWQTPVFDDLMDAVWDAETGLGFNIARYNIGGGQNPAFPGNYMRRGGEIQGFSPALGVFNWSADPRQRRVLDAAIDRGVDTVEAFSNSPPYWMTISQDSSGNGTGNRDGTDNLAPANYDIFAEYLAEVALQFRDGWGVHFYSMIPLNEPTGEWWDGDGGQEGCVFRRSRQPDLFRATRSALDDFGLTELPVSGPEEVSTGGTHDSFNSYPADVKAMLSHVSTHSYGGGKRAELNALAIANDKPLWMSEYNNNGSDSLDSGLNLASRIALDITSMPHVSAWVTWQVVEDSLLNHNWGQIRLPFEGGAEVFLRAHQYDTTAQFSRHIRPGSRIIPAGRDDVVIGYDRARERLSIVLVNDDTSAEAFEFDLSAFEAVGPVARVTRTSQTERQATLAGVPLSGWTLSASAAPRSVTTYVIDGVKGTGVGLGGSPEAAVLDFRDDLTQGLRAADLNTDYKTDAFDLVEMMNAVHLSGQAEVVYELDITQDGIAALQPTEIGNGDDGGWYLAEDGIAVQAFAPRPWGPENGGVALNLAGLTLDAGTAYRIEFTASDFPQGWTTGGPMLVGLDSAPIAPDETPAIASGTVTLPSINSGPTDPRPFRIVFTPAQTVTDPWLIIRTDGIDQGQQRFIIPSLTITRP